MTVRHVSETQEFDFFNSCADGLLEGARFKKERPRKKAMQVEKNFLGELQF